jgi:hypothetical protein
MRGMAEEVCVYQISVQGRLDASWSAWFDGLTMTCEAERGGQPITILTGPIADQSALRGTLNRIWDLNLIVVSVERLDR